MTKDGGEFSITNSNSNYGQLALASSGFRKDAFRRDDVGYITHVIPPKEIEPEIITLEYSSLDVAKIVSTATTNRLYLYQQTNEDILPQTSIQGYKIGSNSVDKLNLNISSSGSDVNYYARIIMPSTENTSNEVTSVKTINVGRVGTANSISSNIVTFSENHQLISGESIRVISENGRLPDGLSSNQVYFAINTSADQIKIAATKNDALSGTAISINNLGGNLKVESRVSDKIAGDIGHPIQYDGNQWYINVATSSIDNTLYPAIISLGTSGLGNATSRTYISRTIDNRGLGERIYKLRYIIPSASGITSARPPRQSFVIQESNDVTGRNDTEVALQYSPSSVTMNNQSEMRNFRFINGATWNNSTKVTQYSTEVPHGLTIGSKVLIENVKSGTNLTGIAGSGFNGTFTVSGISSAKGFSVTGRNYDPGTFSTNTSNRVISLPTYKKIQGNTNLYIYNVDRVQDYIGGEQDGIYNLTVVASNNTPQISPFNDSSSFAFSQPIRNLYPQLDRDNPLSDPKSSTSYALPQPLGDVVVDEVQNSITREAFDEFGYEMSVGVGITDISSTSASAHKIFTSYDHGLNRITNVSISTAGSNYGNGTSAVENLYNARLVGSATGDHATARITVSAAGAITGVKIISGGSNYVVGDVLSVIGTATTTGFTTGYLTVSSIYNNVGDIVKISGITSESYSGFNDLYKITGITDTKQFAVSSRVNITGTSSVGIGSVVTSKAFAEVTGQSLTVSGFVFNNAVGLATITTVENHGLRVNNKISFGGAEYDFWNKDFIVTQNNGLNSFVINTGITTITSGNTGIAGYIPGITAQSGTLTRYVNRYAGNVGVTTTLSSVVNTSTTDEINIQGITNLNLNIGDYLKIEDEIVRIKTTVLNNPVKVFRGLFGTQATTHVDNSVVKKILISPIELRQSSIIRASGHTFEYVGYGAGNYSTALPDRQAEQPDFKEQLLSQSLRSNGGVNVYTGMNDRGDFYIGNKRISSVTGNEEVFDKPVPTTTGDDIFSENQDVTGVDIINPMEVNISRGLKVEGGSDSDIVSEFNGPVVFSEKITSTSVDGIESNNIFLQGDTTVSRKYTVGLTKPTLSGNPGDIVFKANPVKGSSSGWIYTTDNGWYEFGSVSGSETQNIIFPDSIGINTSAMFQSGLFQVGIGTQIFHIDNNGGVGIGVTANIPTGGTGLRVGVGSIYGSFVGDGSGITNLPLDSKWKEVNDFKNLTPGSNQKLSVPYKTGDTNNFFVSIGDNTSNNTGEALLSQGRSVFDGLVSMGSNLNIFGKLTISTSDVSGYTHGDYSSYYSDSRVGNFELINVTSGKVHANDIFAENFQAGKTSSEYTATFPTAPGIQINTNGKIGIGTATPRTGLDLRCADVELGVYHEIVNDVVLNDVGDSTDEIEIDISKGLNWKVTPVRAISRVKIIDPSYYSDGSSLYDNQSINISLKIIQGSSA